MSRAGEERYVFETDWFDIQASLIRKYIFTFYPGDNTIEMVSQLPPPLHLLPFQPLSLLQLQCIDSCESVCVDRYLTLLNVVIVRPEAEEGVPEANGLPWRQH